MRYIKSYKKFSESLNIDFFNQFDLSESLTVFKNDLLSSMRRLDFHDKFNLPKSDFSIKIDLEDLAKKTDFINALTSIKLRLSPIQYTDDFQTFINKPCKFMFIHGSEAFDIETIPNPPINPIYLLFQYWDEIKDKNGEIISQGWSDIELYEALENINNFYSKLSSKNIQIEDGNEKYEYQTSNGNEWELVDPKKENEYFKKIFRKDELEELINTRNVKINVS